jgi:protease I
LLRRNEKVLAFVRRMFESNKLVGAICHAGWVLISAKIVNGVTMTCFYSIKDDVKNAGAKYVDESVVVDNNLITSRQPSDLPDFMREIIKFLKK